MEGANSIAGRSIWGCSPQIDAAAAEIGGGVGGGGGVGVSGGARVGYGEAREDLGEGSSE